MIKETEGDSKKWKDIPCSYIGRVKIVKMAILPKAILRKKNKAGGITRLQTILQSYSNQNSVVLAQKQTYRSVE